MELTKSGASFARGKSKQDYSTPREFLQAVEGRFGPVIFDLAASESNAVAENYYTIDSDALAQNWAERSEFLESLGVYGWFWINPPFGNIAPWAEKCATESQLGARILFLTPASVGADWFQRFVVPNAYILELSPRLCFDGKNPFPKDCVLSVFAYGLTGRGFWRWKS